MHFYFRNASFLLQNRNKTRGINNLTALKKATFERLKTIDLKVKQKDFEHLLFNKTNSEKILRFESFMKGLKE